jgi:2-keto-4-pentenoate hydratase/2-oxohepta-3-ene-1,7-dioic acid hydratase in catechol pathway
MGNSDKWVRFEQAGVEGFGRLDGDRIHVHRGDLFDAPRATGEAVALADARLLAPVRPSKVIGLWNNFGQLAAKLGLAAPPEPLYFIKSPGSVIGAGDAIRRPPIDGKMVFEGELAVVIGRRATRVALDHAMEHVFGFTCVNDVTLADILTKDASFAQWARAKSFDTFCPLGPAIATGLDPSALTVRTLLDGEQRQNYPTSDMRFSVPQLVSLISHDMTLLPGDVILCGTSVGVGSMKPGSTVTIEIDGIGALTNPVEA